MEINQRKSQKQGKKVGFGEWKVLCFNPTQEQKDKMFGVTESTGEYPEVVYTSENISGNDKVNIVVWLEHLKTGFKTPVTFFLEDEEDTTSTGKTWYVNSVGTSSCKDSADLLESWFTKAMTFRPARKGEVQLMNFLRSWLQNIELNLEKGGDKNNILPDMKKLFKGNVKELNDLVKSEYAGTVVALATIRTKGDEIYQNIYNREFLPGYCIKYLTTDFKGEIPTWISRFLTNIKGTYGPKDYFVTEELRDYVEGENPVSSGDAILTPKYN